MLSLSKKEMFKISGPSKRKMQKIVLSLTLELIERKEESF